MIELREALRGVLTRGVLGAHLFFVRRGWGGDDMNDKF